MQSTTVKILRTFKYFVFNKNKYNLTNPHKKNAD